MKKVLIAVLLCLSFNCFADEWSSGDTYREATYLTLLSVDWAQTRSQARNHWKGYYEQNNILGKTPNVGKVDAYFITSALAHYGIASLLPENLRTVFQYVTIGIEFGWDQHNYSLGVKAKF